MFELENGRVTGSIDRARVAELLAGTDDEELKAHYRYVLGEPKGAEDESELVEDEQPKASMALSKDELIALAEAQGVDTEGKTKAELVEALGGGEG